MSTGCQWRATPIDLPPRSTVHDYLDLWSYDGTLDRIHHALYVECRERGEREASPTAAIIDRMHPFLKSERIHGPRCRKLAKDWENLNRRTARCVRREAQRVRALMAKMPRWLLFCGRCLDAFRTSQEASEGLDVHQRPSRCP